VIRTSWEGLPGTIKALDAARTRIENGATGDLVRLDLDLTHQDRADLGRRLGMDWELSSKPVTLGRLRAALAQTGATLEQVLALRGGPLRNLPAERAEQRAARTASVDAAYQTLAATGITEPVVALARRRRWLGRPGVDDIAGRARDTAALWAALPAGGRRLSELADHLYDDPHALDRDRDLGRITARILAASGAPQADGDAGRADAAANALAAAEWRQTWAAHEVLCDEVSATVLVLGLHLCGQASAAALATTAAHHGEPVWLTARSLRGKWAPADPATTVRVCENPAVVEAAADELGAACPPLVCVYGRPSTAAWTLLHGLAGAGTRLLVSADRDIAGLGFAKAMLKLPGALPWLPDATGLYEETRLNDLLGDLRAAV
jgi:uncharacterized protein (TIGR02679 family)